MRMVRTALFLIILLLVAGCSAFVGGRFHSGYYPVRPGDTLYAIAWRYNLKVGELASWNHLSPPYIIYPDQLLRMNPPPNWRPTAVIHRSKGISRPAPRAPPPPHLHWIWPTQGKIVQTYDAQTNLGINIRGHLEQPVVAAAGGRVVYSGNGLPSYGNLLVIQQNSHYLTAYAHCQKLLVHEGDHVKQGQEIATMGHSGTGVIYPALHFEIRIDGNPVNPLRYLPPR